MPAKEILAALQQLRAAGWRVQLAGGQSHAYARGPTARAERLDVRR
jgi:hypothetical protein